MHAHCVWALLWNLLTVVYLCVHVHAHSAASMCTVQRGNAPGSFSNHLKSVLIILASLYPHPQVCTFSELEHAPTDYIILYKLSTHGIYMWQLFWASLRKTYCTHSKVYTYCM